MSGKVEALVEKVSKTQCTLNIQRLEVVYHADRAPIENHRPFIYLHIVLKEIKAKDGRHITSDDMDVLQENEEYLKSVVKEAIIGARESILEIIKGIFKK